MVAAFHERLDMEGACQAKGFYDSQHLQVPGSQDKLHLPWSAPVAREAFWDRFRQVKHGEWDSTLRLATAKTGILRDASSPWTKKFELSYVQALTG